MNSQTFHEKFDTSAQEVQARVIARAWKDEQFKEQLLAHPKDAIAAETGVELSEDFDVRVLEVTDSYLPMVIPEPTEQQAGGSIQDIVARLTGATTTDGPAADTARRQAEVVARAWTDRAFKEELISSPKSVLERELGVEIPDTVRVETLEDSATVGHMILPPDPNGYTDELSDAQLEAVSGGVSPLIFTGIVATIYLISVGAGALAAVAMGQETFGDGGGSSGDQSGGLSGLGW